MAAVKADAAAPRAASAARSGLDTRDVAHRAHAARVPGAVSPRSSRTVAAQNEVRLPIEADTQTTARPRNLTHDTFRHARVRAPYVAEQALDSRESGLRWHQTIELFLRLVIYPVSLIPLCCGSYQTRAQWRHVYDNNWWTCRSVSTAHITRDDKVYAGPRAVITFVAMLGRWTHWLAIALLVAAAVLTNDPGVRVLLCLEGCLTIWEAAAAVWGSLQRAALWSPAEFSRLMRYGISNVTLARDVWYGWVAPSSATVQREVEAALARHDERAIDMCFKLSPCAAARLVAEFAKSNVFFYVRRVVMQRESDMAQLLIGPEVEPAAWGVIHAQNDMEHRLTMFATSWKVELARPAYLRQKRFRDGEERLFKATPQSTDDAVNINPTASASPADYRADGEPRQSAATHQARADASPHAAPPLPVRSVAYANAAWSATVHQHVPGVVSNSDTRTNGVDAHMQLTVAPTDAPSIPPAAVAPTLAALAPAPDTPGSVAQPSPRVRFPDLPAVESSHVSVDTEEPHTERRTHISVPARAIAEAMILAYVEQTQAARRYTDMLALGLTLVYSALPIIARAIMRLPVLGASPLDAAAILSFALARFACSFGFIASLLGGLIIDLERRDRLMCWLHRLISLPRGDEPLLFVPASADDLYQEQQQFAVPDRGSTRSHTTTTSSSRARPRIELRRSGHMHPEEGQAPVDAYCECSLEPAQLLPLSDANNVAAFVTLRRVLQSAGLRFLTRLLMLLPLLAVVQTVPALCIIAWLGASPATGAALADAASRAYAASSTVIPLTATAFVGALLVYVLQRGASLQEHAYAHARTLRTQRMLSFADSTSMHLTEVRRLEAALEAASDCITDDARAMPITVSCGCGRVRAFRFGAALAGLATLAVVMLIARILHARPGLG